MWYRLLTCSLVGCGWMVLASCSSTPKHTNTLIFGTTTKLAVDVSQRNERGQARFISARMRPCPAARAFTLMAYRCARLKRPGSSYPVIYRADTHRPRFCLDDAPLRTEQRGAPTASRASSRKKTTSRIGGMWRRGALLT